jgi:tRNA (guanine-N7-)-methyltransferase
MVMQRHTDLFEWVVDKPADWQVRPSGWPETRYEHKARTVYGHEVWYFRFRRK